MMGTKARSFAPLCNRSREEPVPANNFYRHVKAKLDLDFLRDLVRTTCSAAVAPHSPPGWIRVHGQSVVGPLAPRAGPVLGRRRRARATPLDHPTSAVSHDDGSDVRSSPPRPRGARSPL
jgi:hypothetical protein